MDVGGRAESVTADAESAPSSYSALTLHDLQPDVLHNILYFLSNQDMARLCLTARRLASNTLQACQHWAPKVESWLLADPNRAPLLQWLRQIDPLALHKAAQEPQRVLSGSGQDITACCGEQQHQPAQDAATAEPVYTALVIPSRESVQSQNLQQRSIVEAVRLEDIDKPYLSRSLPKRLPRLKSLNWRQIWTCIERAQQGPWQLGVQALAPAAAPNGVLLTFELLLQQPALTTDSSCEQQTMGWRDSVTIISFVLDKKVVEIVVDANGRVTSPQRDWCQGSIQLQPGEPRLLALEINYIMPVPAWFLHPCTLAAPRRSSNNHAGGLSCGSSSASSTSGMVVDHTWDSYSTGNSTSHSTVSINNSAALCSGAAGASSDECSLMASSMTSSGSLSNITVLSSTADGGCACCPLNGRPRLSLDLSCGFGTYVSDPRYIDAAHNQQHRGLDRMELSSRVCWKPSKVQSWLGRLLPGIRSHSGNASSSNGGNSPRVSSSLSSMAHTSGAAVALPHAYGIGVKPSVKPGFTVSLSKVAAWQVPSDTDRRFAEGFLFWAVQHKLEQLLVQYGILQQSAVSMDGTDSVMQNSISKFEVVPWAHVTPSTV